jgi:DNA-binding NarL/FixJ family response regulator
MSNSNGMDYRSENVEIRKAVRLLTDAGWTASEIGFALRLPESTVRAYVHVIDTAKANAEAE